MIDRWMYLAVQGSAQDQLDLADVVLDTQPPRRRAVEAKIHPHTLRERARAREEARERGWERMTETETKTYSQRECVSERQEEEKSEKTPSKRRFTRMHRTNSLRTDKTHG